MINLKTLRFEYKNETGGYEENLIEYDFSLKEWTEEKITLQINFTYPLQVSQQSIKDLAVLEVLQES